MSTTDRAPQSISDVHFKNLYEFVKKDIGNGQIVIPYRDIGNIPENQ
jgi:hypothetical protein